MECVKRIVCDAMLQPAGAVQHRGMNTRYTAKLVAAAVRALRDARGWTQPQLAERSKLDQPSISRVERGQQGIKLDTLARVADAFGMRLAELLGVAEDVPDGEPMHARDFDSVRIPLISWVQAGNWKDAADPYARGVSDQWVTTHAKVGRLAYALRVRGDSMTNPRGEPSFPDGVIIIVDPDKPADNGSFVIARLERDQEATFKRLAQDAGRRVLVPLNPQYPVIPIDQECTMCGVVVARAEAPVTN